MANVIPQLVALAQVLFIDLVLAGDNAVVVGMAVAGLPPTQKRRAMVLGIAVANGHPHRPGDRGFRTSGSDRADASWRRAAALGLLADVPGTSACACSNPDDASSEVAG